MHPEKAAEVRAWFERASNDLRAADVDVGAAPPLYEDALFHAQQAAEKAMKGFLTAHDRVFRRTHDLDELATACEAVEPTLRATLDPARELTVYASAYRYPGDPDPPDVTHVQEALRIARDVFEVLNKQMCDEAGPDLQGSVGA